MNGANIDYQTTHSISVADFPNNAPMVNPSLSNALSEGIRDQYSRQYSQSGDQTFCILDPAANEQLEISGYKKSLVKGDKAVITVNWRKGLERVVTGDSYSVKVVREEGPRVWLSDGKGNGFIIKK